MTDNELVAKAKEALENSYSPYSHFAVGAALLSTDGQAVILRILLSGLLTVQKELQYLRRSVRV